MAKLQLGRLSRVELRKAWEKEDGDFTPWLALPENIGLLGEAIGLDLEVAAVEQAVGDFRADILCRDTASQSLVLIENQLERTDNRHLGQLITYAAGLQASSIVWVASRIRNEHRAALDWLNEHTAEQFSFFGLEVELWQIEKSKIAPKFNVVCKPNDWSRTITAVGQHGGAVVLSGSQQLQLDYWTGFREYLEEHAERITPTKAHPQGFMDFSLGRSGIWLAASIRVRMKGITALVVLGSQHAESHFRQLEKQRLRFDGKFGEPLEWRPLPERKHKHILIRLEDADPEDRKDWPRQHEWLRAKLDKLHETFSEAIKSLSDDSDEIDR
ncbi:MAG: DUF4268 domain-containing protein [Planctomyces sp.]